MLINLFCSTLLVFAILNFLELKTIPEKKLFIADWVLTRYKLILFLVFGLTNSFSFITTILILLFIIGEAFAYIVFSKKFLAYFGCFCSIAGLSFIPLIIFSNKPLIMLCGGEKSFTDWAMKEGMKTVVKTVKKYPKSSKAATCTFLVGTAGYSIMSGYDLGIDMWYLNEANTGFDCAKATSQVYLDKAKIEGPLNPVDLKKFSIAQEKILKHNEAIKLYKSKKWFP